MAALTALVREFTTRFPAKGAFYAMVPGRVNAAVQLWKTQLPTIHAHYAVKCNPEPILLNMLYDAGLNFDCASERELKAIHDLARVGTASRIVYANPTKSGRDLAAAAAMGSPVTVVDSVEEVTKLAAARYEGGALVRLAVDDRDAAMPFSSKFGAPASLVEPILRAALGSAVPIYGFSFHVGSGSKTPGAAAAAMREAAAWFPVARAIGHRDATTMDIGGGFLPDEEDFRKKALFIRAALEGLPTGTRVIAEPGRFFAANAFDFYVRVIGKKPGADGWRYTVDDSVYGQFTNSLFDQAKPLWIRVPSGGDSGQGKGRRTSAGTLFGRTCDSLDVIAKAANMEELEVGDWLWFPRMGAYTRATASEFNGFPMPDVFIAETSTAIPDSVDEFSRRRPSGVRHHRGIQAADIA